MFPPKRGWTSEGVDSITTALLYVDLPKSDSNKANCSSANYFVATTEVQS